MSSSEQEAKRYRYLRDASTSDDSFYLSVPLELKDFKFKRETVDAFIDQQIARWEGTHGRSI